jgi:hypothetical protein
MVAVDDVEPMYFGCLPYGQAICIDGVGDRAFFTINIPNEYTLFRERPNAEVALPSQAASAEHKIRLARAGETASEKAPSSFAC